MFVIVAKKSARGEQRGYSRQNNHVVKTAHDEVALELLLNKVL